MKRIAMSRRASFVKMHPQSFQLLIETLQQFETENKPIKIKNLPLSKFLLRTSNYTTSNATVSYQVKSAILKTAGISGKDPANVKDEKKMSEFRFHDQNYIALTSKLNKIAKSHYASAKNLSVASVRNCSLVKDCVNLVTAAANIPLTQVSLL